MVSLGRLLAGVSIILFVVIVSLILGFINTGTSSSTQFSEDCSGQNATNCAEDAQSRTDFIDTLRAATVQPFPGAPDILNAIWLTIMVTLLTAGILLVIFSFVPLTAE